MTSRTLSIGDTGDDVRHWQAYLASQGFKVAADGKFGPSTLAATRAMQRKMGVNPDGKVGHRTIGKSETPLPRARPMSAPQPFAAQPAAAPFTSAGPEADLNAMHSAASNRAADQSMAQELQGQYYDARQADAVTGTLPTPWQPSFTDQSTMPPSHALDPAIMAAQGVHPNFDAAGPPGGGGGVGAATGGPGAAGVPAGLPVDPIKRDALIRALLQSSGG